MEVYRELVEDSKKVTMSKKIPMSERPDSEYPCVCGCGHMAKVGSDYYESRCSDRVWKRKHRSGVTNFNLLPEHHVALPTESYEIRSMRMYIKYGTNPEIKSRYQEELNKIDSKKTKKNR